MTAAAALAQAPGLPVLQGAFPAPGVAVAVNVGRADGQTGTLAAVGFGAKEGRLHLDLGAGVLAGARPGFGSNGATYGVRAAVRVLQLAGERVAVTPFVGFGSTRAKVSNVALAGAPVTVRDSGATLQTDQLPIGVALGGRFGFAGGRAAAISVSPFWARYTQRGLAADSSRGRVRASIVVDLAVTSRIGATLGVETGQSASGGQPGPTGTRVGGGVSLAFGRR